MSATRQPHVPSKLAPTLQYHYTSPMADYHMHIASCTVELELYGIESLKDKRQILKSLLTRLPRQFNLAVAEIGHHNAYNSAIICLVTVGNDPGRLHSTLERAIAFIERQRPDVPIADYTISFH